ncbi:hypothetical protein GYN08_03735 [Saccharibacillus sp. VR-M41]|uniref:Heparinase II/III-like C-terminal domain-containing protein n=2 Tax=Saccharibacillus alkalitolerans TaxID=2705290 RepID=A0ABX0F1J2_9BACL|nr:hypothetical protein [Saccharibacillus alkalitolerans]
MLIYDEETLKRTRRLIESDPSVRRGWNSFAADMAARDEAWLESARERVALLRQRWLTYGGSKLFTLGNEVRELAKEAQNLAFYARVTGSEEAVHLVRGLLALLGEEERWVYQSGGGRSSDLWTADIGVYLSSAYDAVRESCGEEERRMIEDMLYGRAYVPLYEDWLHPLKKIHALDTMGHNWWIVCVSAAGLLLLALRDRVPHAAEALHTITESLREWFAYPGNVLQNKQANFGLDGDYVETMGYLDYALGNFLVFEAAYRKASGDAALGELPVLSKIPDLYLETIYWKDGKVGTFHFGDDGDRKKHAYVWLRLADLRRRGELVGLFADIKGDPGEAAEFAFYPEGLTAKVPVSPDREGVAVLEHSGYGFVRWHSGGEQVVLAVKTGESWNHNHLDAGTFMLTVGGRTFADDSGHCAYSKPLYNAYYRQSAAHNVVLFDGRGQPPALIEEGTKFPGSIPEWLDMPGYKYLLADCTGPYSGLYRRFYRHFLCLDGAMVLIDDLQAESGGTFEWLLHMPEGMKISGGTAEPELSIDSAGREMKVLHPYPERKEYVKDKGYLNSFSRETGLEDVFPEADYARVRSGSDDGRIKFVSVFLLPETDGNRAAAKRLAEPAGTEIGPAAGDSSPCDPDIQAIRVSHPDGGHTEIFVNRRADGRVMHDNSHAAFGALETDAFLAALSRDAEGRLYRISLHNGSYIKYGGRCLFSSLLKASAVLDYRGGGLHAASSLSADAWCHFALGAPEEETADIHAAEEARRAGLRHDPDSGLWKRKMEAGRSEFRLVRGTADGK